MSPEPDSSDGTLEGRNITVSFQGVLALHGVTVHLRRGEILGLIGPNGSGKTTLLNVLSRFLAPKSGVVLINGRDVTRTSAAAISRMGVGRTFQAVRLFKGLTVFENMMCAVLGHGGSRRQARERAHAVLEELGLEDASDRIAGTLPYGQQRRVALARTLANSPTHLLLDEPAAGLNEAESAELVESLRTAQKSLGCGVMVIEHDMRLIMDLCSRVHVLDSGRTIAVGVPDDIRHDPRVIEAYLGSEVS